ncbi:tripartite tricarboxylate transporter substrate binding protein [Alcaligenaceae bacterium]|nr:tripartite tricarboxylate transporter substrate binding protein [Alcaligenaceae bacterium]
MTTVKLGTHKQCPATGLLGRLLAAAAGVMIAATPAVAAATNYPTKPIIINVPFSAGGTTDILARAIGQQLGQKWGVSVVVENKPGAGGNIGTAQVARSAPDGHTLVMGTIGTHAINPNLYKDMPYDAVKDFEPITRTAMVPNALIVQKDAPYSTVQELIEYGKANPGKLTFGSSGHGSTLHMSGETFKMMTGVDMVHVPYKGSSPAVADLLGGQISMIFDNLPSALPHVKAGSFKALGVTSAARAEQLPDVPTVSEAGVQGYEVMSWFGLWAPKGTPPEVVKKLNAAVVEIINDPDMQQTIRSQGAIPHPEAPEEFAAFIASETKKWGDVVRSANLTIQ